MKIDVESPTSIEATVQKHADGKMSVLPIASASQASVRVCYLTATGDGGATTRAMVVCNTKTGQFHVKNVKRAVSMFEFDKLAES